MLVLRLVLSGIVSDYRFMQQDLRRLSEGDRILVKTRNTD